MSAPTQYYKAFLQYGGIQIPTLPGARITCPKNYVVPPIIGNYWQFNFAEGLRQPVVDVQCVIRNATTEVLSTAFLNTFLTRSNDVAHDTTALTGGVIFWDGRSGFELTGAKADSFSIGCSKGDDIRFSCRFCGNGLMPVVLGTPGAGQVQLPSFTPFSSAAPMRFQKVAFGGGLANIVWRFNLNFSNNHHPNLSLDGTSFPTDMNAGMQTVSFDILCQAVDDVSAITAATFQIGNTSGSPADAIQRVFTLGNIQDNTPDNRGIDAPRVMRSHSYLCLGVDGTTTPPLVIS